jgi:hypothetical protein
MVKLEITLQWVFSDDRPNLLVKLGDSQELMLLQLLLCSLLLM